MISSVLNKPVARGRSPLMMSMANRPFSYHHLTTTIYDNHNILIFSSLRDTEIRPPALSARTQTVLLQVIIPGSRYTRPVTQPRLCKSSWVYVVRYLIIISIYIHVAVGYNHRRQHVISGATNSNGNGGKESSESI